MSFQFCFSQAEYPLDYFRNPLDIPIILASNFAELRSNHFHSGLDIKTELRQGLNVYTAAEGYVSRIKISYYGYGKALYVTHPNGYTTVYAHLRNFSPKLEKYIKQCQYQKESYEVEVFPGPDELPVTKDEVIAFSGNTGGSTAPHLHFEVRDNQERPLNPMLFGVDIKDTKPPYVTKVYAYAKDENSLVNHSNNKVELRLIPNPNGSYTTEKVEAFGAIGFGIASFDKADTAPNIYGLYNIETFLNGNKTLEIDFNRFSFDETKHINRFIDYELFKTKKSSIQKLFVQKGNPLSLFKSVENDGYVNIEDGTSSVYKIRIQDYRGNETWVTIPIVGKKMDIPPSAKNVKPEYFVNCDQPFNLQKNKVSVYLPSITFYEDVYLDFDVKGDTLILYKDIIPLQKSFSIYYDVSNYKEEDKSSLYVAELTGYYKKPNYIYTTRKGDSLIGRTSTLGTFALESDYVKPKITPINFVNGKWISKEPYLKVKIEDNESGISSYRATINGKWILMEYEYKTDMLTYNFDDKMISETENNLKIIVTDNVGNSSTFEATFYRK